MDEKEIEKNIYDLEEKLVYVGGMYEKKAIFKAGYKNALREVILMLKKNGGVTIKELQKKRNDIKLL